MFEAPKSDDDVRRDTTVLRVDHLPDTPRSSGSFAGRRLAGVSIAETWSARADEGSPLGTLRCRSSSIARLADATLRCRSGQRRSCSAVEQSPLIHAWVCRCAQWRRLDRLQQRVSQRRRTQPCRMQPPYFGHDSLPLDTEFEGPPFPPATVTWKWTAAMPVWPQRQPRRSVQAALWSRAG